MVRFVCFAPEQTRTSPGRASLPPLQAMHEVSGLLANLVGRPPGGSAGVCGQSRSQFPADDSSGIVALCGVLWA